MFLLESRAVQWIIRAFGKKDATTPIQDKEEEPPLPNSIQVYFEKNHAQWKKSFENTDKDWNENMAPVLYTRGRALQEIVESSRDNELEISWRRRVLMETTPRGNIMMYYDIFLDLFVYFADEAMIPFDILNAAAMRYTLMFRCRDFFQDEKYLPFVPNKYMESKEKEKTTMVATETKVNHRPSFLDDKSAPFLIPKRPKAPTMTATRKIEDEKKKKVVFSDRKYENRFKYMGKFANYSLLQKMHKPRSTKIIPSYHDEDEDEDDIPPPATIPVDKMTYSQYMRHMMEQRKREEEMASMLAKLTINSEPK
jgi:hypothetical protein